MQHFPLAANSHHCVSIGTGAIAAGAGADSEVFQFRWTDTTKLACVYEVSINGMRASTAFTAGDIDIKLTKARAWTAAGTGGNTLTMTGDESQLRTSMPASSVGEIRIATTAALGAGTKTLDTQNLGTCNTHSSGGTGSATPIIGSIFIPRPELFKALIIHGEYPLILTANEGFVVRATVPATGVWTISLRVKWAEIENSKF